MKNKTVKMVLAVVVLGVCCGAYAGVKTYVAHQEQKESEEDSEESTTVFTALTDNIKSLDFMVDDTETTFEKDDDSWVKKDETDFPVNQTTLDSAASAIASVDSDRVLEDVDDLSEYGLDSPSNTIKIVTKSDEEDGDDITTTLYVGDENSSTSQYYVRKDDDEKTVYLIDSSCVEPFTKSLNDYAQMDDFPAISNTDTITKISVDGDNSYKLSTPFVNTITNIVYPVLGIVQAIGGILTIVSIAILGFGMILSGNEGLAKDLGMNFGGVSGPEAKRKLLDFGRSLMIGSILMFSSATLVQFVFRVLKG